MVGTPPSERELPQNVTVRLRAPLLRLLQQAAPFVSGGGYNAIMAALLTGTPVVGLPGRVVNVRRVAALHAGVLVPGLPVPAEHAIAAMRRVLDDRTFTSGARAAGAVLRALPGPIGVAEVLAEV